MGLHHLHTVVSMGGKSGGKSGHFDHFDHFDHGKIWEISDSFRILTLEGWRIFGFYHEKWKVCGKFDEKLCDFDARTWISRRKNMGFKLGKT